MNIHYNYPTRVINEILMPSRMTTKNKFVACSFNMGLEGGPKYPFGFYTHVLITVICIPVIGNPVYYESTPYTRRINIAARGPCFAKAMLMVSRIKVAQLQTYAYRGKDCKTLLVISLSVVPTSTYGGKDCKTLLVISLSVVPTWTYRGKDCKTLLVISLSVVPTWGIEERTARRENPAAMQHGGCRGWSDSSFGQWALLQLGLCWLLHLTSVHR
uniref:Uncharacterized protein n=1 Tax=Timema tahoe TaxID=61484 RepID=A0A7R9IQQ3_9NEOP|nr:unnamed protein product [Timema tahoe]